VPLFKKALTNKKHITFVGSLSNGPATVEGETFPTQHEGHVGWSLLAIVAEAPAPSQDSTPHIVLMMGGTNDVRYASGAAAAPQNANQVLETLFKKYPDALIVMAQIPPMSNSAWNAAAMAFNATLPATVSKHAGAGKHVVLVDMHTGFPSSGLADGVHPNATGCEHIANTWYQAISDFLR
jgi:lysophospholipase L1-like esterase